jgi:hypothetical protein
MQQLVIGSKTFLKKNHHQAEKRGLHYINTHVTEKSEWYPNPHFHSSLCRADEIYIRVLQATKLGIR